MKLSKNPNVISMLIATLGWTEDEAAKKLITTSRTIRRWKKTGKAPMDAFIKLGRFAAEQWGIDEFSLAVDLADLTDSEAAEILGIHKLEVLEWKEKHTAPYSAIKTIWEIVAIKPVKQIEKINRGTDMNLGASLSGIKARSLMPIKIKAKAEAKAKAKAKLTKTLSRIMWGGENDLDVQLYQGDCFEGFRYVKDKSVDLILADLPYGTTACKWDSVIPLDLLWAEYKRVLKPKGVVVLTSAQPFTTRLGASNLEWLKYELIWEKPNGTNPMLVKSQPFRNHESILVFYNKKSTYNPQMVEGGEPYSAFRDDSKHLGEVYGSKNVSKHRDNPTGNRYPKSVQKFAQERGGHPTQKPVELMSWLVKTYSNEGDLVLDNTMGSGTTGVACVQNNRRFVGMELESNYFKIATKRIGEAK